MSKKGYEDIRCFKANISRYALPDRDYYVEVNILNCKIIWQKGLFVLDKFERPMASDDIKWFINGLHECRVLSWKQEYIQLYVLDGTHWSIEIEFADANIRKAGSNAYPKEWGRFCKFIGDFVGKTFE